jgi:hypothetical protein
MNKRTAIRAGVTQRFAGVTQRFAGVTQRFNVGTASRRRTSILEGLCLP